VSLLFIIFSATSSILPGCADVGKRLLSDINFFYDECSILTGFDVDGQPIIYTRPGRENTETSPRQLRHLVYILYVSYNFR
jgi:hypothetical protein